MSRLVAPSRDTSWHKPKDVLFAREMAMVPLAARELPYAALNMPVAFAQEGGGYTLVALLSFLPGQNLFVSPDGKWMARYIPAQIRAYPFRLVRVPGENAMALRVEENAVLEAGEGEPFYDDSGDLARPVEEILEFLKETEQSRIGTEAAVSALADAGLLTGWDIKVNEKPVRGICRIDEDKLNKLDDETFLRLRKIHALALSYAQLLSMGNIRVLQRLAEYRDKTRPPEVDIETMFGEDDIFKF